MKSYLKTGIFLFFFLLLLQVSTSVMTAQNQDLLSQLGQHQNYTSKRISSYDRTGGNNDRLSIEPGKSESFLPTFISPPRFTLSDDWVFRISHYGYIRRLRASCQDCLLRPAGHPVHYGNYGYSFGIRLNSKTVLTAGSGQDIFMVSGPVCQG